VKVASSVTATVELLEIFSLPTRRSFALLVVIFPEVGVVVEAVEHTLLFPSSGDAVAIPLYSKISNPLIGDDAPHAQVTVGATPPAVFGKNAIASARPFVESRVK